jgi:hypothetical protein
MEHRILNVIKVGLSILLFLCLADMPYGYYQIIRFVAMIGFGILAFQSTGSENKLSLIFYGALALLFQPFFKIALGRELWNIVDVIISVGLIISLFHKKNRKND